MDLSIYNYCKFVWKNSWILFTPCTDPEFFSQGGGGGRCPSNNCICQWVWGLSSVTVVLQLCELKKKPFPLWSAHAHECTHWCPIQLQLSLVCLQFMGVTTFV